MARWPAFQKAKYGQSVKIEKLAALQRLLKQYNVSVSEAEANFHVPNLRGTMGSLTHFPPEGYYTRDGQPMTRRQF